MYLLVSYIPVAGVVSLSLQPSQLPLLFKDILFVIPSYIGFTLALATQPSQRVALRVPIPVLVVLASLAGLAMVHALNPQVQSWLVAAIGLKVWLFYLPLLVLAGALIDSLEDLLRVLRLMVALSWIPCLVGLSEFVGSSAFGYETTMRAIYGEAASGATQRFQSFEFGAQLVRIPSTFTYWIQYGSYTLSMIVPAYALWRIDTNPRWQRVAGISLGLLVVAAFLSGAKVNLLFVPLLILMIYVLEGRVAGVVGVLAVLAVLFVATLSLSGIDLEALVQMMGRLLKRYLVELVIEGFRQSLSEAPLGLGTGMNTGPARYAFTDATTFRPFENYYAKSVYELGIPGLVLIVLVFGSLATCGWQIHRRLGRSRLRGCSAAFLAFVVVMALNSLKGWQMDVDPINVYFWLFAGVLLKLPALVWQEPSSPATLAPVSSAAAPASMLARSQRGLDRDDTR